MAKSKGKNNSDTLVDKVIKILKNNPISAGIILLFMLAAAIIPLYNQIKKALADSKISLVEIKTDISENFDEIKDLTNEMTSINNLMLIKTKLSKVLNFKSIIRTEFPTSDLENTKIKDIEEHLINYIMSDTNNCGNNSSNVSEMKECLNSLKSLCDLVLNYMTNNGIDSKANIKIIETFKKNLPS